MEDRIALTVLDDDLVLPKCGPAYLSLEGLSKAKSARTLIRRLAINELTGVLGIPERRVELRADDAAFLCQLGLDAVPEKSTVPTTLVDALIDALCAPVLPSKLKARWHLQLPKGYEAETERLEEAGWRCVRKIHQLDELYEAEGMVTFDHNNWGKIIKILQRSGRDITVLPQLVDIEAEKLKKLGLQNP